MTSSYWLEHYLCMAAACAASLARCGGSRPDPPLCISPPIPFARELFLERNEPKNPDARLEARLSLLSVRWNLRGAGNEMFFPLVE